MPYRWLTIVTPFHTQEAQYFANRHVKYDNTNDCYIRCYSRLGEEWSQIFYEAGVTVDQSGRVMMNVLAGAVLAVAGRR